MYNRFPVGCRVPFPVLKTTLRHITDLLASKKPGMRRESRSFRIVLSWPDQSSALHGYLSHSTAMERTAPGDPGSQAILPLPLKELGSGASLTDPLVVSCFWRFLAVSARLENRPVLCRLAYNNAALLM